MNSSSSPLSQPATVRKAARPFIPCRVPRWRARPCFTASPLRTALLLWAAGTGLVMAQQGGFRQRAQEPLPAPKVSVEEKGGWRIIRSNGLPNHKPGQFPNAGNPNFIAAQEYEFRVTLNPKAAQAPRPADRAFFGVAVNGVPFEPGTAEFWNRDPRSGWVYEAKSGKINLGLDEHEAHVQPNGAYHYHGLPKGLLDSLGGDTAQRMLLVGWAADGFPIYASHGHQDPKDAQSPLVQMRSCYRLKQGRRPDGQDGPGGTYDGTFTQDYEYVAGSGDLDECNGRFGVTPEHPQGIYHYHLISGFPYMGRFWKGEPDASFQKRGGGPPGMGPPGMNGGPPGMNGGGPRRGRRGGPGFGPGMGPPPGFGPPAGGPPPGDGPPPGR